MEDDRMASYLATRRSIPAAQLGEPGPDPAKLQAMLTIAARVPDHGKLAPWRFIVFDRNARQEAIAGLVRMAEKHPEERERRVRAEKAKGLGDAPIVVAIISAPIADHPKIPVWEQELSSGAVALNLLHAASAYGFSAQWLTGWYAYDEEPATWLGRKAGERFTGFVHIGTAMVPPTERDRPDIASITTAWARDGARGQP